MKIAKKLSWHAAAVAAAVVVSGAAYADHRGHYDNGYHGEHRQVSRSYDHRSYDHQRAWRDHGPSYYRSYDRGYRYVAYPRIRYYDHYRPHYRYYAYDDGYYYGSGWPVNDFGASLTFQIPLR